MKFEDFHLHLEFFMGNGRWRVTDVGTRTVCAIRVDQTKITTTTVNAEPVRTLINSKRDAEAQGWFRGPPYAVAETVIDEDDQLGCTRLVAFALGLDDDD
jgi:hypothetical protein